MKAIPGWINWIFLGMVAVALATGFLFYPSPRAKQISVIVALFVAYAFVGMHLGRFAVRTIPDKWREYGELAFMAAWIGGPYLVFQYLETR